MPGIVVPYLDTAAMAGAVGRLLDDEATRKTLAEAAQTKMRQRHDAEAAVPVIVKLLPKLYHSITHAYFDSYKELIDRHDVISFDIFDTLITRKVSDPNIVFDLVEYAHTVNDSAALPLLSERMETAGRVLAAYAGAVDDITIDQIYDQMSFYRIPNSRRRSRSSSVSLIRWDGKSTTTPSRAGSVSISPATCIWMR